MVTSRFRHQDTLAAVRSTVYTMPAMVFVKHLLVLAAAFLFVAPATTLAAGGHEPEPAYTEPGEVAIQYAEFPKPVDTYKKVDGSTMDIIVSRAKEEPFNAVATLIFLLAILHTFASSYFLKLSHHFEHEHEKELIRRGRKDSEHPDGVGEVSFKASLFHFLGEVEAVFGMWAIVLGAAATYFYSWDDFVLYVSKDRDFTEPLFVFAIMAIAASRPILMFAEKLMSRAAAIGKGTPSAWWLSVLIIAPVLGSFITEPAAMTIGALLLSRKFYRYNPPATLAYATLGLLFVNVSVGGTLTNFAAPPVLMVAGTWEWSSLFMVEHFGWKALVGILISSSLYFLFFRKALFELSDRADGREDGVAEPVNWHERDTPIPAGITMVHLFFLGWTVYNAHHPVLFIGGLLFFIAFSVATRHHQNPLSLRSPILVAFFLAGLVIHGGCQGWWIAPIITSLSDKLLMLGATVLTAFNDNAAITYLAAQVHDITLSSKHAVVAGAVTGGGLTVIANAPNPAGQSILSKFFRDGVSPLGLFLGAIIPTLIVYACFTILPNGPAHAPAEQPAPAASEIEHHPHHE